MPNPVDDSKERCKKKWGVCCWWNEYESDYQTEMTYAAAKKEAKRLEVDTLARGVFVIYIP